ncbi:MAG: hypothetical protein WDZ65_06785, partial [Aquisalimonadaceae bacterium]
MSDHTLLALIVGLGVALFVYLLVKPSLPELWQRPGTPVLQTAGIVGSILLLVPFAFSLGKRAGTSRVPNRLFILHVLASVLGSFLVAIHAAAGLQGPPLVILACLLALVVTGVVARVHISGHMAATFGTKSAPFLPVAPELKDQLRNIIRQKQELLRKLDPQAQEALFSVTLRHWVRAPRLSLAFHRLARREARLIGERASVRLIQAYWRPLHIALAWVFLAGLAVHVIVVTFFAGYAAGEGEIYWWH